VSSVAGGGKCGQGMTAAVFGKYTTNQIEGWGGANKNSVEWLIAKGVVTSIAGGAGSVIAGGKFDNGAVTAAMGYLFNFMSNKWLRSVVPGQIQFDHGMTAIEEGRFGVAALHFGAMLGEQVATVLTLGEYSAASAARGALAVQWESRFVFQSEHMTRHLEGTGLAVDAVKQAIVSDMKGAQYSIGEIVKRDIVIGGQALRYHAFPLKDGSFRIGTIGTPPYGPRF
jgi:hypothetical protein